MELDTIVCADALDFLKALPDQLIVFSHQTMSGRWTGHVVHWQAGQSPTGYMDKAMFDEPDMPLRRALAMARTVAGERWYMQTPGFFSAS